MFLFLFWCFWWPKQSRWKDFNTLLGVSLVPLKMIEKYKFILYNFWKPFFFQVGRYKTNKINVLISLLFWQFKWAKRPGAKNHWYLYFFQSNKYTFLFSNTYYMLSKSVHEWLPASMATMTIGWNLNIQVKQNNNI